MSPRAGQPQAAATACGPGGGRPVVVDAGERRVHGDAPPDRLAARSSAAIARVSGSDSGAGPGNSRARGSAVNERAGKFRFRSTSRAEFLRPRASPSGLAAGISQSGAVAPLRRSRAAEREERVDAGRLVAVDAPQDQQRRAGARRSRRPKMGRPRRSGRSRGTRAPPRPPAGRSLRLLPRALATLTPFHAPANVCAMPLQLRDLKNEARNLTRARRSAAPRWPRTIRCWRRTRSTATAGGRSPTCCFSSATRRAPSRSSARWPCTTSGRATCCRRWSAARCSSRSARTSTIIVAAMARNFAHGAPTLAKFAARQAPVDLDAPIEPPPPRRGRRSRPSWCPAPAPARWISRCSSSTRSSSCRSPSSPSCRRELFPAAVRDGAPACARATATSSSARGSPGSAFYFVAAGEVRVVAGGKPIEGRPPRAVELHPPARGGAVRRDGAPDRPAAHRLDPGGGRGRPAGGRAAPPSAS